ncbi:MAG: DUF6340 family protein [Bacteroidia bacterium]|nr:DUF6340 family protein [Bacteroidia bacterium]
MNSKRNISLLTNYRLAVLIGGNALLSSCASTNSVSLQVLQPAEVSIPANIKKVVIANRSLPSKDNQWKNLLEGFLSQETVFGDRDASFKCINGLADKLNSNPRIQAIVKNDDELKGTGTKEFPPYLDWAKVHQICRMYDADALVLLETFDSDIMFRNGKNDVKKTINNKEVVVPEYWTNLDIHVNAGWRIYDAISEKIIDENTYRDSRNWNARDDNADKARAKLPGKRHALNEAGEEAGTKFGVRISPNWITVYRSYYVRKHDDFKRAKQMAKAGNWDGAAEIWNHLTTNHDPEVAARACYNMALAAEIKGDLDLAITWANKAIKEFNFRPANQYLSVLQNRLAQENRLNQQMENK